MPLPFYLFFLRINIVTLLLHKYPDLIDSHDFIQLLTFLQSLQSQCRVASTSCHLYRCLCVLADIEDRIHSGDNSTLNSLWVVITECTLRYPINYLPVTPLLYLYFRAVGLNQNEEQAHELLQKLITNKVAIPSAQLFGVYSKPILNASKHSLHTLDMACNNFGVPTNSSEKFVQAVTKWILNLEKKSRVNVFAEPVTAHVLTSLVLKQWPKMFATGEMAGLPSRDTLLEDTYYTNTFEGGLLVGKKKAVAAKSDAYTCLVNTKALDQLNESLNSFISHLLKMTDSSIDETLFISNSLILICNVLSSMVDYGTLTEADFQQHALAKAVKEVFQTLCRNLTKFCSNVSGKSLTHQKQLIGFLERLEALFSCQIRECVSSFLIASVPLELVKQLFEVIRDDENDEDDGKWDKFVESIES